MTHRYENKRGLTLKQVKAALADRGMTISRDTVASGSTGSGEYRVTFKPGPWPKMTSERAEDLAHYTNDLDDAFQTGVRMAMEMTGKVGKPRIWNKRCRCESCGDCDRSQDHPGEELCTTCRSGACGED